MGSGEPGSSTGDSFDILIDPADDIWAGRGNALDRRLK